ncbi:OsmC family protein [Spongiibacter nanhainus]|uniref:OsmC family protein n=1 Tax=Spongiibacter nanhainus TaxID=2794344 RepID=A0A7T4QXT2_9GAMM|nr:OsmC family protein [Spongiibacter nanhainus]QQD16639.1 OsmC family protein [Spongiibacter nanhainus]
MQNLPHHYSVSAAADNGPNVANTATNLPPLTVAAPAEFDGPGDQWSPESLLCAAVVNCFILSFKAIAQASRFEWQKLDCEVTGVLDKVERSMQFTRFDQRVCLTIADEGQRDKALKLLEKAEQHCLVSNSLNADVHLDLDVRVA